METLPDKSKSLRVKSIMKRLETERNKNVPKQRPPKQKHAPMSKYRRKTANAKERDRMRCVNDAFEKLKSVLPDVDGDEEAKGTKVNTLRFAITYINSLQQLIDDSNNGLVDPSLYGVEEEEEGCGWKKEGGVAKRKKAKVGKKERRKKKNGCVKKKKKKSEVKSRSKLKRITNDILRSQGNVLKKQIPLQIQAPPLSAAAAELGPYGLKSLRGPPGVQANGPSPAITPFGAHFEPPSQLRQQFYCTSPINSTCSSGSSDDMSDIGSACSVSPMPSVDFATQPKVLAESSGNHGWGGILDDIEAVLKLDEAFDILVP